MDAVPFGRATRCLLSYSKPNFTQSPTAGFSRKDIAGIQKVSRHCRLRASASISPRRVVAHTVSVTPPRRSIVVFMYVPLRTCIAVAPFLCLAAVVSPRLLCSSRSAGPHSSRNPTGFLGYFSRAAPDRTGHRKVRLLIGPRIYWVSAEQRPRRSLSWQLVPRG
jgi:hypothetical protein